MLMSNIKKERKSCRENDSDPRFTSFIQEIQFNASIIYQDKRPILKFWEKFISLVEKGGGLVQEMSQ